jgi:hypothetical protein
LGVVKLCDDRNIVNLGEIPP